MIADPQELRNTLGRFATGVAIVTADVDGHKLGATISSFNSVSLDPPLVLFSIARNALSIDQWKVASAFAICVLGEEQATLSNRFAQTGGDKWSGIEDRRASNGAPLLPNWLVCFECEPYAVYDGGDHEIFVVRVARYNAEPAAESPLVFFAGKYRGLRPGEGLITPPDNNMFLHGW